MKEFFEVFFFVVVAVIIVIGGIAGIVGAVDYLDCVGFESATGTNTRWRFECYAEIDGKWVPKKYIFGDAYELRLKDKNK